jgi:RNA polymerase sigma factor (sigma-70 family)
MVGTAAARQSNETEGAIILFKPFRASQSVLKKVEKTWPRTVVGAHITEEGIEYNPIGYEVNPMASRTVPLPGLMKRALTDSLSEWSDHQLLSRFVESGDEAAFAIIMDRHGPMLYGVCRRLLGESHLADDVLQATFLLLSRQCGSIRKRNSLGGWLYRVAHRLAQQAQLADTARSRREQFAVNNRTMEPPRDPGWDELCLVLDEELRRLPERYRIPLLLCYLEGRTQDEAAKQLDWSVRTLRRRLEHARNLLKTRMIRRGATLGVGLFAGFLAPSSASAVLTPELRQSILTISTGDAKSAVVSTAVMRMVDAATHVAIFTKIGIWSAVALAFVSAAAGVIQFVRPASDVEQPIALHQPPQSVDQNAEKESPKLAAEPGLDQFRDRLPDRAVVRLGTVDFRHGATQFREKSLTFTADGKHLVSMGGGWIRRWDLATGKAVVNLGDGWAQGADSSFQVTADGKTAWNSQFGGVSSTAKKGYTRDFIQYDLASGAKKQSYRLKFHPSGISPPIFSSDGKVCAGFGHLERDDPPPGERLTPRGESIVLWNVADGAVLHEFNLDLKDGNWQTMVFAPDGRSLIIGDTRHTIRIFDVTTGKEQRTFGVANVKGVAQMAVSPDGKILVTRGGGDSFIRLWELHKGTEKRTFDLPEGSVTESLLFASDSSTLFAGVKLAGAGRRFAVYSWNVESGTAGTCWTDEPTIGATLALSPDNQLVATLNSETGVIQFWDRKTGKEKRSPETNASSLGAGCFRPDGKTILTVGDDDLAIREWDAPSGRLHEPPMAKARGRATQFAADGKALIGRSEKSVWLQDPATGKVLVECPGTQGVLSRDGKHLATTDEDGRVRLVDMETAKIIADWLPDKSETRDGLRSTVRGFSADGKSLILQGDIVSVWDVPTRKRRSSWSLERNKVLEQFEKYERLSKSPEPRLDGQEFNKGKGPKFGYVTHKEKPESVALSPDGGRITFAVLKQRRAQVPDGGWSYVHDLRLTTLETATGKVLHQTDIENADGRPWQIALSPDGGILAAGAWKIHVWDLKTGKEINQFDGHRAQVTSLAFSPDSRRLVSASKDSTALVWELSK